MNTARDILQRYVIVANSPGRHGGDGGGGVIHPVGGGEDGEYDEDEDVLD